MAGVVDWYPASEPTYLVRESGLGRVIEQADRGTAAKLCARRASQLRTAGANVLLKGTASAVPFQTLLRRRL